MFGVPGGVILRLREGSLLGLHRWVLLGPLGLRLRPMRQRVSLPVIRHGVRNGLFPRDVQDFGVALDVRKLRGGDLGLHDRVIDLRQMRRRDVLERRRERLLHLCLRLYIACRQTALLHLQQRELRFSKLLHYLPLGKSVHDRVDGVLGKLPGWDLCPRKFLSLRIVFSGHVFGLFGCYVLRAMRPRELLRSWLIRVLAVRRWNLLREWRGWVLRDLHRWFLFLGRRGLLLGVRQRPRLLERRERLRGVHHLVLELWGGDVRLKWFLPELFQRHVRANG